MHSLVLKVLSNENRGGSKLLSIDPFLINCLAGCCPFPALNGHHHEASIKFSSVLVHFDAIRTVLHTNHCSLGQFWKPHSRDRKTFPAWGIVKKLCCSGENVSVSTPGFFVLGNAIFRQEAKKQDSLWEQCAIPPSVTQREERLR
jgi:hypothetical protein